jgi:hypothetical protein
MKPPTMKRVELVPVPAGVLTAILPVLARVGTVAVIRVEELTVKVADLPLKVTEVAPVKLPPVIVTSVPARPLAGVKLVIQGVTVKFVVLVPVPADVVTAIVPVVAPVGT